MRPTLRATLIGGTVGVLAAAGVTVAVAQIPSANGTISACYMKSGGALRVIDAPSAKCKTGETLLTWNQAGQPGADGKDGTNGTDGVSGYEVVSADRLVPGGGIQSSLEADCPAGKKVLGGGVLIVGPDGSEHVSGGGLNADVSGPLSDGSGFYVGFFAPAGLAGYTIRAQATCATVTP